MGSTAAEATAALIEALKDEDEYVRKHAAFTLGEIGSQNAVPALIEGVRGADESMREFAVAALAKIGPAAQAAVPALIELLSSGSGPEMLPWRASEALGKIGPDAREAVPALVRALEKELLEETWGRRTNSIALGQIGPEAKEAVPTLMKALRADDEWVCAHAAEALGRIGTPARVAVEEMELIRAHPPSRPPGAPQGYVSPEIDALLREAIDRISKS